MKDTRLARAVAKICGYDEEKVWQLAGSPRYANGKQLLSFSDAQRILLDRNLVTVGPSFSEPLQLDSLSDFQVVMTYSLSDWALVYGGDDVGDWAVWQPGREDIALENGEAVAPARTAQLFYDGEPVDLLLYSFKAWLPIRNGYA